MAGAISGTTIAAIAAMMASAAMQYKASQDAAKRATEATQRALERQSELQRQAEGKALDQAKEFNTDDRADKQQEVTAQLEEEFARPAEAAQTINQEAATTQGNVSKDYVMAKAASDANQMKSARALAALMAKTTGANRLRQNEAIDMANTAANIDRLGSFSRGQAGADELSIKNAGRVDSGMTLAANLIGSLGAAYGMSQAGSAAASAAQTQAPIGYIEQGSPGVVFGSNGYIQR